MGIYHRPGKLKDALQVLAQTGVRPVAGCTDVFAATEKPWLSGDVLDITGIDALREIVETEDEWWIGAGVSWSQILKTPLPPAFDMLKQAAREVGGVQVQNAGTLVGNICNASPAADGMPPLLALDAQIELHSIRGHRRVPLSDFVTGPRQIERQDDELVSAIVVPAASARGRSRFLKLGARKHLVISIVMVAARLEVLNGTVTSVALSVGACGPVARRISEAEAALTAQAASDAALLITPEMVENVLSPISDVRATDDYRREAAVTLLRRSVVEAMT